MKSKFWLTDPESHDFPAAADFLDLLYPVEITKGIINSLEKMDAIVFALFIICLKILMFPVE